MSNTTDRRLSSSAWLLALAAGMAAGARRRPSLTWRNQVVLVTGGSRGLGLALAREMGSRGARIAICARDADTLGRARRDLTASGIEALAIEADVSERAAAQAAVAAVQTHFGHLDVLVNNAGIITVGPLETMTLDDFDTAMRTNFWAGVYTTDAALPGMRANGGGRIVNVASIGAKISVPHLVPYSASKFAFAGFSEGLRTEAARHGIIVTTVYPGLMRTGSPRHALFKGRHHDEYAWFNTSDSLPLLAMDVDRAARRIVAATGRGDPYVILSLPAKLAITLHALFPGLTADMSRLANRILPNAGGIGTGLARGRDSTGPHPRSWVKKLSDRAAQKYNQAG
jgi:NAD(P)-dependent dehydrogenase (short-subunit alcohol dehydrogenase family)